MNRMIVIALLLLVAACTSDQLIVRYMSDTNVEEKLEAQPMNYRVGWVDGCRSSIYEIRRMENLGDEFRRDLSLFRTDADYQLGWQDGMRQCTTAAAGLVLPIR